MNPCLMASRHGLGAAVATRQLGEVLERLENCGAPQPNHNIYVALLRQCGEAKALAAGRRVHAQLAKTGLDRLTLLGNFLISVYGKCGSIDEAKQVFAGLTQRNVFSWSSMIAAFACNGYLLEGVATFDRLPQRSILSWNTMVTAYINNGRLEEAEETFRLMPERDLVSWNSVVVGYAQKGCYLEACRLFQQMSLEGQAPNRITFLGILDACGCAGSLHLGRLVHDEIVHRRHEMDVQVATAVVVMYGKCGNLDAARAAFDQMPPLCDEGRVVPCTAMMVAYAQNGYLLEAKAMFDYMEVHSVVTWTAMVSAYSQNGQGGKALTTYRRMQLDGFWPNKRTLVSALDACSNTRDVATGRQIHDRAKFEGYDRDALVGGAMIYMYGKCGYLADAKQVFDNVIGPNNIAATALISAYSEWQQFPQAMQVFRLMDLEGLRQSRITFISILDSCNVLACGKEIQSRMAGEGLETELVTGTALTGMYKRCGSIPHARLVFESMLTKNPITWTVIISAYVEAAESQVALSLFRRMNLEGDHPDDMTLAAFFDACANSLSLAEGRRVHDSVDWECDLSVVGTTLIHMYAKCGNLVRARSVLTTMAIPHVLAWTSMVTAYAHNGRGLEAVELFRDMELQGIRGNEITMVSVLCACSHAGLTEEGLSYFFSLVHDRSLNVLSEHHVCMVDLFGRAGLLDEAEDMIEVLDLPPDDLVIAWTSLLGACKVNGDAKRADRVAQWLVKIDPEFSLAYIVLSGAHSGSDWERYASTKNVVARAMGLMQRTKVHAGTSRHHRPELAHR